MGHKKCPCSHLNFRFNVKEYLCAVGNIKGCPDEYAKVPQPIMTGCPVFHVVKLSVFIAEINRVKIRINGSKFGFVNSPLNIVNCLVLTCTP